jgi:hypothetical protein
MASRECSNNIPGPNLDVVLPTALGRINTGQSEKFALELCLFMNYTIRVSGLQRGFLLAGLNA